MLYEVITLIGIMLQQLLGYPVMLAGLVQAPRGIATMLSMIVAGQLMGKVDTRILLMFGLFATGIGFYMMSRLSLDSHQDEIILSGIMLAIGSGMMFVPLSTIVFSTLDPALRSYNFV